MGVAAGLSACLRPARRVFMTRVRGEELGFSGNLAPMPQQEELGRDGDVGSGCCLGWYRSSALATSASIWSASARGETYFEWRPSYIMARRGTGSFFYGEVASRWPATTGRLPWWSCSSEKYQTEQIRVSHLFLKLREINNNDNKFKYKGMGKLHVCAGVT